MQRQRQDGDEGVGRQQVAPAYDLVFEGIETEGRGRGPQPQRLQQNRAQVVEFCELALVRGGDFPAQNPVDFFVGFGEDFGMLQQELQGKGKQARRGLVPGDQEGVDLIADVLVLEPLAGQLVDSG